MQKGEMVTSELVKASNEAPEGLDRIDKALNKEPLSIKVCSAPIFPSEVGV